MSTYRTILLTVLCSTNASLMGMVGPKKGVGLLARSLVRFAHSNNDIGGPIFAQKILRQSHGSITVPKKYEGSRISTNRAPLSLITALYMRGKEEQYAFLANYNVKSCSKSFEYIQQGIQKGVETCTKNKKNLERLVAIFTMPDSFFYDDEGRSDRLTSQYIFDDFRGVWLEPLQEVIQEVAHQHNTIADVTTLSMDRKNRQLGLFLHRDPKKSHFYEKDPGCLIKELNK